MTASPDASLQSVATYSEASYPDRSKGLADTTTLPNSHGATPAALNGRDDTTPAPTEPNAAGKTTSPVTTGGGDGGGVAPVGKRRVKECWESATFWAEILAYQADGLQKKADTWSISAAVLAAFAGLSAWKLITDQTNAVWAIALTSIVALAASICAIVPRIKNYAENAALSRELSARYGQSKGVLSDTLEWMESKRADDRVVRAAVAEFEVIKKSKDSMRYVPIRSEETRAYLKRKKSLSRNIVGRRTLPSQAQGSR